MEILALRFLAPSIGFLNWVKLLKWLMEGCMMFGNVRQILFLVIMMR